MKRFGRALLGVVLACSLAPAPAALADNDADGSASPHPALAAGTYVEHEAVAYVIDGAASPLSTGDDMLAGAESLMEIDSETADEALGIEPAAKMRNSASSGGEIVLVRNEDLSTEGLIAALEADPRVVFAEPNLILQNADAENEALGNPAAETTKSPLESALEKGAADGLQGDAAAADDTSGRGSADEGAKGSDLLPSAANGIGASALDDANADAIVWGTDKDEATSDLNRFVWGFDNDGRMGNVAADDAIDMRSETWRSQNGSGLDDVVVAVVDSGVDASHPDLAPAMWNEGLSNPELASVEGADEHGFAASADPEQGITSTTGLTSYHGTHVAGTIGAEWDGKGISGLAPNAKIMSVRHNDTYAGLLSCYAYLSKANDAGANVRVANNSWGLGQGAWRAIDLVATAAGRRGITSFFASGNSSFDTDAATATVSLLADNPYVVVANSIDPSGKPSLFTEYGLTTTDVMAPGSGVLSTWGAGDPQYLGEADADAVAYESFDEESRYDASVEASSVAYDKTKVKGSDTPRFDGSAALVLPYDPGSEGATPILSNVIWKADLSNVAEKPLYLSIRFRSDNVGTDNAASDMKVMIKATDGEWIDSSTPIGAFGYGRDSWGGFYVDLQACAQAAGKQIDWKDFQVAAMYLVIDYDVKGGDPNPGAGIPGDIVIDSVGLGSDLVPYSYQQGTSMAAPAVAGAATAMAGKGLATVAGDPAKSAEKLAALVRAAAEPRPEYEELCSTGGFATVDGTSNPGPAITKAIDEGDSVRVEGYFLEGAAIAIDGEPATKTGSEDLGDGKTAITVQKPAGFAGGQAAVSASAKGKDSRHLADLGKSTDATYYDETDLPVPDELAEWGSWQLVGFAGDVYCLPRNSLFDYSSDGPSCDHMLRYDPDARAWDEVPFPLDLIAEENGLPRAGILDASAATCDGSLLVSLFDANGGIALARYEADGTWSLTAMGDSAAAPLLPTLASDGKQAFLFGGYESANDSANIYRIDVDSGQLHLAGQMTAAAVRPQVSYGNGAFVVSGGVTAASQMGGVGGAEIVRADTSGTMTGEVLDTKPLLNNTGQLAFASGAAQDGFLLAGPESADGTADTYFVNSTDNSVTPYGKRASQQRLLSPAATAYNGRFYVLAASQNEPYRLFSATAVETTDQAGDAPKELWPGYEPDAKPLPEPEPSPEPVLDNESAAPNELARTGDSMAYPLYALTGAAVLAAGSLVATAMRRRS